MLQWITWSQYKTDDKVCAMIVRMEFFFFIIVIGIWLLVGFFIFNYK